MLAGGAAIQVRQPRGEHSPVQLGYGTQSLTVFIDDVDEHYARAKAAGAEILEEPHETVYGEYQCGVEESGWPPLTLLATCSRREPRKMGAVATIKRGVSS
jgi:hypothetical protein